MMVETPKPKRVSKAQRFYLAAKELGWDAERIKATSTEGTVQLRTVVAKRGQVEFRFMWEHRDVGPYLFLLGERKITVGDEVHATEWKNVRAALREMAEPDRIITSRPATSRIGVQPDAGPMLVSLPFDPIEDDDKTILTVVAGKSISWVNSLSGLVESGTLPRGGMHLKMDHSSDGKRCITFPDRHSGFRSVDPKSIVSVG